MQEYQIHANHLMQFIEKSPSVFHAIENLKDMACEAGFVELKEAKAWNIKAGGKYFVTRNDSTIAAFQIPDCHDVKGFHIIATHSDSPTFKVKENPEMCVEGQYVKLNAEMYGGTILNTWMDRPLSIAGRITYSEDGKIVSRLVNIDRDLLVIPNVAIHMNREINKGMEYNIQTDMLPLYTGEQNGKLLDDLAECSGIEKEAILAHDLFLYVRDKGRVIGSKGEFILSPRLDNLQCSYSAMKALTEAKSEGYITMFVAFDNEEVGSGTRQGADSTFLEDVLTRIKESLGYNDSWLIQRIADSFLISADNAHAVHPNHPEKSDPTNRPYLNGGIVIKYHGSQKYTTDAMTAAYMKELCRSSNVPVQTFANRSDMVGGSTLGNVSTAHVSVPSVDIGLPQLAMHSAVETGGVKDTFYALEVMKQFYSK